MRKLKIRRFVSICIMLVMQCEVLSSSKCSAAIVEYKISANDDFSRTLKASELLKEFQDHSKQVKQITEKYSLKNIEAQISEQTKDQAGVSVAKISGTINTYYKLKSELELSISTLQKEYDTYIKNEKYDEAIVLQYKSAIQEYQSQLSTVKQQISSLNESYYSANTQYYNHVLESNLNQFYVTNRKICEQEETNQLLYDFYSTILSLIPLNEQKNYYDCNKKYLETQEKIEKIKFKNGLSTTLNVSNMQAIILANDVTRSGLETSFQSAFALIYDGVGYENIGILVDVDTSRKIFNSNTIIETILKENSAYLKLKDMITIYKNYLVSGACVTLLQQQQINELVSSYETQKSLLEKSVKRYVENSIKAYDQSVFNLNAISNNGDVLKQQFGVVQKQYIKGRATLLNVESMELESNENEAKYYQAITKKMKLEYILSHSLYGIAVE